jgi:hypothetical protein
MPANITNIAVSIVGSAGNSDYTGIKINADGSLSPDRSVAIQVHATSPGAVTWKILSASSDVEKTPNTDATLAANVDANITYDPADPTTAVRRVKLCKNKATPANDDYNVDANATVTVQFTDAGSQTVTATATIRLNTRIYKSAHKPIDTSDQYQPLLRETPAGGGTDVIIPQTMILNNSVVRTWHEIWYPVSHGTPVTVNGDVDTSYVLAPITVSGTTYTPSDPDFNNQYVAKALAGGYDPIGLTWDATANIWKITLDDDGRPITSQWTRDGSKDYGALLSSSTTNLTYWVIDNSGFGDFYLEFEHFDLDANIFGPPFNPLAPHKGDVLVVYDATDPAALQQFVDATGKLQWRIADSTRLREIMAFTGSGVNVIDVATGHAVGAGPNGDFKTQTIVSIPKVVLMFYSDPSESASGFKLKAGRQHQKIWTNWDLDPNAGEAWVHKYVTLGSASGAADTTTKSLTYYYQQDQVTIDHENQTVTFGTAPTGTVTIDFSYYETSTPSVSTFLASYDDLVDYQDAPVYAGQAGHESISSTDKTHDFNDPAFNYGRIVQGATWDKDRGVVTLSGITLAANQRLFADHYHHTYTRLTSDGHGDMVFHDAVLVADLTNAFPDYTWGDVKISNEGTATLEQGIVKFGFRGYDTNNDGLPNFPAAPAAGQNIDRVLDPNRPWDIQKGTEDETFDRLGMFITSTFIWPRFCPRPPNGQESNWGEPNPNPDPNLYKYENMTARGIIGTWQTPIIGNLDPRTWKYGRMAWVLCGAGGTSYPTQVTAGPKRCSLEVSGKYFDQLIF